MIGQLIGNYKILEKFDGTEKVMVYKAFDLLVNREVLIKTLNGNDTNEPEIGEKFHFEAETLAKLSHPAIPAMYSLATKDKQLFMVMEFPEGEALDVILKLHKKLAYDDAVRFFIPVLDGLDHAHRAGIFHGSLSPDQIIISGNGTVKVLGFGKVDSQNQNKSEKEADADDSHISDSGTFSRKDPEFVADVFAVGMMLFEALTGSIPYFPLVRTDFGPAVPEELAGIITKALDQNPAGRYPSAGAFREALRQFEHSEKQDAVLFNAGSQMQLAEREKSLPCVGSENQNSTGENSAPVAPLQGNEEKNVQVYTLSFMPETTKILKNDFVNSIPAVAGANRKNRPPVSSIRKIAQSNMTLAGLFIIAVIVLHFVFQFNFIRQESLPVAETHVPAKVPPKPAVAAEKTEKNVKNVDVVTYTPKKKTSITVPISTVQSRPKQGPPRIVTRKKTVRENKSVETRADRLRRAEKILTGF